MKYSLRKDIESIVGGLYRMNATTAEKYAYCHNEDKSKVYSGEFRFIPHKRLQRFLLLYVKDLNMKN
jgi:hypothetical protein